MLVFRFLISNASRSILIIDQFSFYTIIVTDIKTLIGGKFLALHAERIANSLTAKRDPSWLEAELQDRILEEDLEFQLNNLKAYINNPSAEKLEMPGQQRAEKIHSDMEMMDHGISIPTTADVYSSTPEAQHTASVSVDTILSFVLSGNTWTKL